MDINKKLKLYYFAVGILLLNCIACTQQSSQSDSLQTKIIENEHQDFNNEIAIKMLKNFYTMYINEFGKSIYERIDYERIDSFINKFATKDIKQQIEKVEADYNMFINTEHCEKNWLDNMSIYLDSVGKNNFIIEFNSNDKKNEIVLQNIIKLHLIKDENDYKIDKVFVENENQNFNNEEAIKMLKNFYTTFITANYSKNFAPFDEVDPLISNFTTKNFKQKFSSLDGNGGYNVFINTEHCEKNWLNWLDNMSIYADSVGKNNFIVKFNYDDEKNKRILYDKIKLHLIKDGNDYKIDKVLRIENGHEESIQELF